MMGEASTLSLQSYDLFPTRIWQAGHANIHLTPSTGLLVLFPCWMEHYVEPHESDEPRICIAFNAIG